MRRAGKEPFGGPIRIKNWTNPAKWEREAQRTGRRFRIFTCSMSDFFHAGADKWRGEAWEVIRNCPHLDWLILTKRPELIQGNLPSDWVTGYPNVWLGVTCGFSSSLRRVEVLTEIPAAIRFISAEPLLGPVNFRPFLNGSIHWIITGCERAAKETRFPMDTAWVRGIDAQCRRVRIPHFFKQHYDATRIVYDAVEVVSKESPEWRARHSAWHATFCFIRF